MPPFGLVGPAYTSLSIQADCQRLVNRYLEINESGKGKSRAALYPAPGKKRFATLGGISVRGINSINNRVFAVSGPTLYEVLSDGTFDIIGTVVEDTNPAFIACSDTQIMVVSGGRAYYMSLADNVLHEILTDGTTQIQGRVYSCLYADGYFFALLKNSNKFQISGVLDASSWDPLDIATISLYPDNTISMWNDHREVWFQGPKASVVYYNSGNPLFPWEPIPGGYVEQGNGAPASMCRLDNSLFWIGADERGPGVGYRAQGYTPARITNHAIEAEWRSYPTIADAVAFAYQEEGHGFWVIYFPTANKTWCYDVATGTWSERDHLKNDGTFSADRARCHVYAFGKHLVGDPFSGNIYDQSIAYYDDDGTPMQRRRRAPHICNEQQWMFHQQLQVDMETGIADQPPLTDGQGNPRGPQITLRWSNDGGKTWSNDYVREYGQAGQYKTRVIWRRLGRARDRVYELVDSDPVPSRIIEGYLDVSA